MERIRWGQWDRWMRASHLYTGLFLAPWMTVYAISAFCLNHSTWFSDPPKTGPKWTVVRETDFPLGASFPEDPHQQAPAILKFLELDGAYRMPGDLQADPLVIYRSCAAGQYRVNWHRKPSRLVVERYGPTSFYLVVNNFHFQHGYDQQTAFYWAWAVIVDIVTVSTVIWVISGIYLWARRPRKRLLGALCLTAGCVLFAWLAVALCR